MAHDARQTADGEFTLGELAAHLDRVEGASRADYKRRSQQRRASLKELFTSYSKKGKLQEEDLWPLMRLLAPREDRERLYGLKEAALARALAKVFTGGEDSDAARALRDWKSSTAHTGQAGDLGDAIYTFQKNRPSGTEGKRVTIRDLVDKLGDIAEAADGRKKFEALQFFRNLNPSESKWVVRIVLKDMKLHMDTLNILQAYCDKADQIFKQKANLEEVCKICCDKELYSARHGITPGTPVLTMLADKTALSRVAAKVRGPVQVEDKLDGERLMLHIFAGAEGKLQFKWLTRNCNDFTNHYGAIMREPILKHLAGDVKSLVIDGEMMAYDTSLGRYAPFGNNRTMTNAHRDGQESTLQPCYLAFDCIYYNGKALLDLKLVQRREYLEKAFKSTEPHCLEMMPASRLETGQVAKGVHHLLEAALCRGSEGLVIKPLDGEYQLGARGWLKIKPDYNIETCETLDVLVIGAYYGRATGGTHWRSGNVSHFLLGVRAPEGVQVAGPNDQPLVYPFCKVGTGYNRDELLEIIRRLAGHLGTKSFPEVGDMAPAHFCGWMWKKRDDKPDVWFPPEHAIVFEVLASEIINSDSWKTQLTLRFPRLHKVRYDKTWKEVLTYTDLVALHDSIKSAGRTLASARRSLDPSEDGAQESLPRGPKRRRTEKGVVLGGQLNPTASAPVEHPLFPQGCEVAVMAGDEQAREMLETTVRKAGGAIVKNPTKGTKYVIVHTREGRRLPQPVTRLLELHDEAQGYAARVDAGLPGTTGKGKPTLPYHEMHILHSNWLLDSAERGELLLPEPKYALRLPVEAQARVARVVDHFGDRYEGPTDETLLAEAMGVSARHPVAEYDAEGLAKVLRDLGDDELQLRLDVGSVAALRTQCRGEVRVYIAEAGVEPFPPSDLPAPSPRASLAAELRLLGAQVVANPRASHVTHVVVPGGDLWPGDSSVGVRAFLDVAKLTEKSHVRWPAFVTSDWVNACAAKGTKVDEQNYLVVTPALQNASA